MIDFAKYHRLLDQVNPIRIHGKVTEIIGLGCGGTRSCSLDRRTLRHLSGRVDQTRYRRSGRFQKGQGAADAAANVFRG